MTEAAYQPFPAFERWVPDFDTVAVDAQFELLQALRDSVSTEALEAAVTVATRYAAVDTGAIEGLYQTNRGFTKTIATQAANWQTALSQHGEVAERSINDALAGYEMVLDAATQARPISESWIRQLHETLCRSQETYEVLTSGGWQQQQLPKGEYKTQANNPTSRETGRVHHYAPPSDVPAEMARFLGELRTRSFEQAHPVVQAAYAHYAFVCIHPFADGNGRVTRALASVFLYRRPGVPLVVFADQKDAYIDALEAADAGDPTMFQAFVAERVMDTVGMVRVTLQSPPASRATAAIDALRDTRGRAGLQHAELDALNARISTLVQRAVVEQVKALDLPSHTSVGVAHANRPHPNNAPTGYRATQANAFQVNFHAAAPGEANRGATVTVWSAKPSTAGPDFVVTGNGGVESLEVELRDIHPVETQVLEVKIDAWVHGLLVGHLEALAASARAELVKRGYLEE